MAYKTFTVLEALQISQGKLKLDKAQAERRADFIEKDGDGYNVVQPVWFKAGETFGYDGELPRVLLIKVEEGTPSKSGSKKATQNSGAKSKPESAENNPGNEALVARKTEIESRLGEITESLDLVEHEDAVKPLLDEEEALKTELADLETKLTSAE